MDLLLVVFEEVHITVALGPEFQSDGLAIRRHERNTSRGKQVQPGHAAQGRAITLSKIPLY
jgi:hypothetical protein